MESPAEPNRHGAPVGDPARALPTEDELRRSMIDARVASGDALLHALYLIKVVRRLRAVAPDLVEAAEAEVLLEGLT